MSQQVEAQRVSDGALLRLAAALADIDKEFEYSFSAFNGHAVKLSQLDEDDSAFGYNTFFIMEGKLTAGAAVSNLNTGEGKSTASLPMDIGLGDRRHRLSSTASNLPAQEETLKKSRGRLPPT